jgi:hypothetical protein
MRLVLKGAPSIYAPQYRDELDANAMDGAIADAASTRLARAADRTRMVLL